MAAAPSMHGGILKRQLVLSPPQSPPFIAPSAHPLNTACVRTLRTWCVGC